MDQNPNISNKPTTSSESYSVDLIAFAQQTTAMNYKPSYPHRVTVAPSVRVYTCMYQKGYLKCNNLIFQGTVDVCMHCATHNAVCCPSKQFLFFPLFVAQKGTGDLTKEIRYKEMWYNVVTPSLGVIVKKRNKTRPSLAPRCPSEDRSNERVCVACGFLPTFRFVSVNQTDTKDGEKEE